MRWAFWRRDAADADSGARSGRARDDSGDDPAALLRIRTRRRVIGAAALLLAAAVVVPMLLDSTSRPVPDTVSVTMPSEKTPFKPRLEAPPAIEDKTAVGSTPPVEAPPVAPQTAAAAPPPAPAPKTETVASAPKAVVETAAKAAGDDEKFALQVAALSKSASARELVARLKKAGFTAYMETTATPEGTRYRVRVGPFAKRDDAQRMSERMRAAGFTAALVGA